MVTYPIDHYRKSPMMNGNHKEFPPRVNVIDTFPGIQLLYLLVTFFMIGVSWREYHKNENTKKEKDDLLKKVDDLLKQIDDLLRKLDKGELDGGVLWEKIDKMKQEKDEIAQENEQLKKEIERKKDQFKSAWRDIPLYPDWRKEEFQTVNLTLDAATAHPALFLSEEGRRVTWLEPCQDLPSCPERFVSLPCVLGQSITIDILHAEDQLQVYD